MTKLEKCECGTFVSPQSNICPTCSKSPSGFSKLTKGIVVAASGVSMMMTLSACYGGGCVDDECSYNPEPDAGQSDVSSDVSQNDVSLGDAISLDSAAEDSGAELDASASADAS